MTPDQPGFQFHRVERSEHDHFWSARVSDDLRFIVHHDDDVFDESEREDFLERERNLLYVAATRAREQLIVTYTGEPSPFLDGN